MRLDDSSTALARFIALAAFNAVRIDRTLRKEAVGAGLADLIPEDVIELLADDMALLLRIINALEFIKEMRLTVDADKVHIKQLREGLLNEIALILAHESLIDKDTCELLADCTAQKCGCNRGIHAAGKAEHDLLITDLCAELCDCFFDEIIHDPVAGKAADMIKEIVQQFLAEDAVRNLGVELYRIELS